jgi:secernin
MGCDMVAALGRATADTQTLFAHSMTASPPAVPVLRLVPGRGHAPGERVTTRYLDLPQVKTTFAVLGCSTGGWGYEYGVNECGVAVGRAPLRTCLACGQAGLLGDELVRLTLERARTAQQGADLLTDLIRRYGQGSFPGAADDVTDSSFLIADAREAFAIEACGPYYVWQQLCELRVLGPLGTVRQDWDRIAPGLSEHVLQQGWWPADGSKIDFAGCVCPPLAGQHDLARRWGRATLRLSEQSGHITVPFLRRLLGELEEDAGEELAANLVVALNDPGERPLVAWTGLGPRALRVFFPLLLEGDLPPAFCEPDDPGCGSGLPLPHLAHAPGPQESGASVGRRLQRLAALLGPCEEARDLAREALDRLQARFDQETEDFAADTASLRRPGGQEELRRQATFFMQHCVERFEEVVDALAGESRDPQRPPVPAPAAAATLYVFDG